MPTGRRNRPQRRGRRRNRRGLFVWRDDFFPSPAGGEGSDAVEGAPRAVQIERRLRKAHPCAITAPVAVSEPRARGPARTQLKCGDADGIVPRALQIPEERGAPRALEWPRRHVRAQLYIQRDLCAPLPGLSFPAPNALLPSGASSVLGRIRLGSGSAHWRVNQSLLPEAARAPTNGPPPRPCPARLWDYFRRQRPAPEARERARERRAEPRRRLLLRLRRDVLQGAVRRGQEQNTEPGARQLASRALGPYVASVGTLVWARAPRDRSPSGPPAQVPDAQGKVEYRHTTQALLKIYKTEGAAALYKGCVFARTELTPAALPS